MRILIAFVLAVFSCGALLAQTSTNSVRQLPPRGIEMSAWDRAALQNSLDNFAKEIRSLTNDSAALRHRELWADVMIYYKAVDWALRYQEFYRSNEIRIASELLRQGQTWIEELKAGKPLWPASTGLVVRAYLSQIDQSVQPYGLVVPAAYAGDPRKPRRLDIWFHGRDDNLTELKFIDERQKKIGEFAPPDTFVLHPYGRYMNAFKFAGETDVFEALEDVKRRYAIDANRISVRGFSMGGAATWHMAAHHAGLWVAAAPGAGFAETPAYLTLDLRKIPWFEQRLWPLYNATDYAANLFNTQVIAYSGENDKQRQAAEIMAEALKDEGMELTHLIGPNTEHRYEPATKRELARRFDEIANRGRDPFPQEIHFRTWTLRYNKMAWLEVDALDQHWAPARLDARIEGSSISITTTNVRGFTIRLPQRGQAIIEARINGESLPISNRANPFSCVRNAGKFAPGRATGGKRHGLQGPIDDAFMEAFIFVRPTGRPLSERARQWTDGELKRAIEQWRAQFRGDAIVKSDLEISDEDIARNHLVLWGDPESNKLLARMVKNLPLQWNKDDLVIGGQKFPTANHVGILICPNPLNRDRYVVLNSGFTFRGFGSNADQTPKLPDYAIVNLNTPPSVNGPGELVAAGFFDEAWQAPSRSAALSK